VAHLDGPVVLAVSGGRDSMCLLDGAVRADARGRLIVACFDHATGPHARDAVRLVRRLTREAGFELAVGRAAENPGTEAGWRALRWKFLNRIAREAGASILTAHHRDDQVETVMMRLLRGAGSWGMAGLRAASRQEPAIRRPFLDLSRAQLAEHASNRGLVWCEDPANADLRFFRNRVRHELLPALERAHPGLTRSLDHLSREAGVLRAQLLELARTMDGGHWGGLVHVGAEVLSLDEPGRRLLWSALLQRARVVLDRRGYQRLGAIDVLPAGAEVQLSGGISVAGTRRGVVVHRRHLWQAADLADRSSCVVGPWRLRVRDDVGDAETGGEWLYMVGPGWRGVVRPWKAGDRWQGPGCRSPRLVTKFLAEAGVPRSAREGWPVIEVAGEIVWVPGTRRAPAAPPSPGRTTRWLHCEYTDG
jgi:tRNA(Ile)-lysidine synthase